eukprot:TRINITY_DN91205_c0_g1_i1.p1 TRINITY_DN91205_c0_g1~~TRINITY_DN91205_c0_g1_i1.p1  ORF type:complete len:868 (-),score=156.81 TRINITY_DN91205_c0_g1_i1:152-2686(-)
MAPSSPSKYGGNSPSRRTAARRANEDTGFVAIDAAGPKEKFPRPPALLTPEAVYGDGPPQLEEASSPKKSKEASSKTVQNASRQFMWSTTESVIIKPQHVASTLPIPLATICAPFADGADAGLLPLSEQGKEAEPLRCPRCRSYANPFFRWSAKEINRFQCNMCTHHLAVRDDFLEDMDRAGQSADEDRHPEFTQASVDFVAPGAFDLDRPAGPTVPAVVFLLEASTDAVESGLYDAALKAMERVVDDTESPLRRRVCLMTFDESLHFFVPTRGGRFRQVHVRSIDDDGKEDPLIPVSHASLFVDTSDDLARGDFRDLAQLLQQQHQEDVFGSPSSRTPSSGCGSQGAGTSRCSVAGSALSAAIEVLTTAGGGDVLIFHATSPSAGRGAPLLPEVPEKTSAPQHPAFYQDVFARCTKGGVAVNVVTAPTMQTQLDLETLQWLSWRTGGDTAHLPNFTPQFAGPQLEQFMVHWAGKMQGSGYSCVVKLRCSKGLQCKGLVAPWPAAPGSTDQSAFELPRISPDTSFVFELQPDIESETDDDQYRYRQRDYGKKLLYMQLAVLYTNTRGQRLLRVHTTSINVVHSVRQVYQASSIGPLMAYFVKKAADTALDSTQPGSRLLPRDFLLESALKVLSTYQQQCCYSTEVGLKTLVVNQRLKLLPVYMLGARKLLYSILGTGMVGNELLRKLMRMPIHSLLPTLYPRIYPVKPLEREQDGTPCASNNALPTALAPIQEIVLKGAYPAYVLTNGLGLWVYRNPTPAEQVVCTPEDCMEAVHSICEQLRETLEPGPQFLPLAEITNLSTASSESRDQKVFMATLFVEDEGFTEMSYRGWVDFLQGQVQSLR